MDKIHWHPGFQGATEWGLKANKDDPTFEYDHPLNKETLKMDALIIKKDPDVIIQNEIGKLFKSHNIVEYKGVGDALNIDVIYKVLAYACLYKSLGDHVNEIPAEEVSITIMRAEYPKDLFDVLESSGIHMEEKYPGIYYLTGRIQFETQIVVFSRLDETHPAYRILRPGAAEEDVERFLKKAQLASEPWEKADIRSLIEVSVAANSKLYEKIRKESKDMGEAIQALFQEDIDKKVAEGEKKKRNNIAEAMLSDGEPVDKIIKYTGIAVKDLQEIAKRLGLTVSVTTETVAGENMPK